MNIALFKPTVASRTRQALRSAAAGDLETAGALGELDRIKLHLFDALDDLYRD